jgi:hypothetical protein
MANNRDLNKRWQDVADDPREPAETRETAQQLANGELRDDN